MNDDPPEEMGSAAPDETPRDVFEVRITGTAEEISRILRLPGLDIGCRHPHVTLNADGAEVLHGQASAARIEEWRAAGFQVERGANIFELARALRHEIGEGDRFAGGRIAPRGLGLKTNDREGRRR